MKHARPLIVAAGSFAISLAALAQNTTPAGKPADTKDPAPVKQPERVGVKATTPEFHEGTQARHDRFNAISKEGKAKLVFVGDSITEAWEGPGREVWEKFYATRHAANFGISGDRTEHVLWRLDHGNFDGLSPDLVVIMIGTNNTGHRQDKAEETAAGIKAIIARIEKKCPKAKVLLLGVFPRSDAADHPHRKLNVAINEIIKGYADDTRVFYKDIGAAFTGDKGELTKDIMPDYLHLSPEGYRRWAEAIEDDVATLLGEKGAGEPKPAKADKPATPAGK
ncbi:MAG: GDSL family lipase [Phycisphaerae bacterium]|nr:GDSL family lipase [Phycisphaerae bacterium]